MKYYGHKVHINDIATKVIFYKKKSCKKGTKINKISFVTLCVTCIFRVVVILWICVCKARVFQMMTIFCVKEGFPSFLILEFYFYSKFYYNLILHHLYQGFHSLWFMFYGYDTRDLNDLQWTQNRKKKVVPLHICFTISSFINW